jgi:hypothetical protein
MGNSKFDFTKIAVVVMAAILVYQNFVAPRLNPAAPQVAPAPAGPNLLAVFAANSNRGEATAHARAFGGICRTLAEIIEKDPAHRIKTGRTIEELRNATREFRLVAMTDSQLAGATFSSKYPQLGPAVGAYLDVHAGVSPKELDPATRAKWVAAFRTLAASSDHAADNL